MWAANLGHSHASGGFPHVCHVSLSCGRYQAVHSTCVQNQLKKDRYVEQQIRRFTKDDLRSELLTFCELCIAIFHISMVLWLNKMDIFVFSTLFSKIVLANWMSAQYCIITDRGQYAETGTPCDTENMHEHSGAFAHADRLKETVPPLCGKTFAVATFLKPVKQTAA